MQLVSMSFTTILYLRRFNFVDRTEHTKPTEEKIDGTFFPYHDEVIFIVFSPLPNKEDIMTLLSSLPIRTYH